MRPFLALIAAVVAALLLSACNGGGDDPPDSTSTWTPSGTIEETQSPTPSTNPLTEAPANETAKQFLERWVELGNQMIATGDSSAYVEVVGPDCTSCHKLVKRIIGIYDKDGSITGGSEHITRFQAESATQWIITRHADPTSITPAPGEQTESLDGGDYRSRVWLGKVGGKWVVAETEGLS